MDEKKFRIVVIFLLVVGLVVSIFANINIKRLENNGRKIEYGSLQVASALAEKKMYKDAAREYEKYLGRAELSESERKNVMLALGNMLLTEAKDYNDALVVFVRMVALYPKMKIKKDVEHKIAECLSRLGRGVEADRMIDKAVSSKTDEARLEKKVARIGGKFMTYKEFLKKCDELPQMLKIPMKTKKEKIQMLYQVLQQMVIEKEAEALDIRNKKSFIKQMNDMEKLLLRQYIITENVLSKLKIDDQAIKYYYEANKDKFRNPSKFKAVIYYTENQTKGVELIYHLKNHDGQEDSCIKGFENIDRLMSGSEISKKIKLPFDISPYLSKASKNDLIGPFSVGKRNIVIKITAVQLGYLHPLNEVKNIVKAKLTEEKQKTKLMEYFQKKFKDFDIKVYEESFN